MLTAMLRQIPPRGARTLSSRVTATLGKDGVAVVTLDRGKKMNALDERMFDAVVDAAADLRDNGAVRAVVIHGSGRSFCAGLDMASILKDAIWGDFSTPLRLLDRDHGPVPHLGTKVNLAQALGWVWRDFPVPVMTALHGVCFGGGLQLALGADLRFCDPKCRLSVMEAKWGLIPDMGGTVTLRELMPMDVAKELTMTGRMVTGAGAYDLGLVNYLSGDPLAAAMEHARELVGNNSRDEAMAIKQRMLRGRYNAFRCTETGGTQGGTFAAPAPDSEDTTTESARKEGAGLDFEIVKGGIGRMAVKVGQVDCQAVRDLYRQESVLGLRALIVSIHTHTRGASEEGGKSGAVATDGTAQCTTEADMHFLRDSWHALPIPVVASIPGDTCDVHSLGAALGADFRIVTDGCEIEVDPEELQRTDNGSSAFLRTLVAREHELPAGIVSGKEARAVGLITR
jgi:enoyl-CoA hydratase/carnithine racemase